MANIGDFEGLAYAQTPNAIPSKSPIFAIYSCKDDKIQQLSKVYIYFAEKYQHYPQ